MVDFYGYKREVDGITEEIKNELGILKRAMENQEYENVLEQVDIITSFAQAIEVLINELISKSEQG